MAKENQKFQQFQSKKDDVNFAIAANALQDYDSISQQLDAQVILKETIRAQTAEIQRLNAENNDYCLKLASLVKERDEAMFNAQIFEAQVGEQKIMLNKLLHAVKTAGCEGESLYHEFKVPHAFSKRSAIGFMGRFENMREMQQCDYEQDGAAGPEESLVIAPEVSQARLQTYEARIQSLILERDGISSLLTKRLTELQASLIRTRTTLEQRLADEESHLKSNSQQLVEAVKLKTQSDQRCLRLESDVALLAAKGAVVAQKAKESAKDVARGARREIRQYELNQQKEAQKQQDELKGKMELELKKLKQNIARLERELQESRAWAARLEERNARLEARVRDLGDENACVREALMQRLK